MGDLTGGAAASQPYTGLRRVPLFRRCRLQGESVDAAGVVCNLSFGGTFVAIEPVPRVGDQVRVSLQLPWREQPMAIDAVVCWDNSDRRAQGLPPGCGLEFLAPAWDDRLRIEGVVRGFPPRG